MERIIRNVAEIDTADRQAVEHLLGRALDERHQIIISVVTLDPDTQPKPPDDDVPPWWNIYEGLGDVEVNRLDQAIRVRANLARERD